MSITGLGPCDNRLINTDDVARTAQLQWVAQQVGRAHVLSEVEPISLLLLVCVSFTIIGQPRNSVLIRRV